MNTRLWAVPALALGAFVTAAACRPNAPSQNANPYQSAPYGANGGYYDPASGTAPASTNGYPPSTSTTPPQTYPTATNAPPPVATASPLPTATASPTTTTGQPAPTGGFPGLPFPFPFPGMGGAGGQGGSGGSGPGATTPTNGAGAMLQPLLTPLQSQYAPGSTPEGQAISGFAKQGVTMTSAVNLTPGRCYTGIAVASPPVSDILLELVAAPPAPLPQLGLAQAQGGNQVVMAGSPNCFRTVSPLPVAGVFRVTVRAGSGPVLAQLYAK